MKRDKILKAYLSIINEENGESDYSVNSNRTPFIPNIPRNLKEKDIIYSSIDLNSSAFKEPLKLFSYSDGKNKIYAINSIPENSNEKWQEVPESELI